MVKIANYTDSHELALMMLDMYVEMQPNYAVTCIKTYTAEVYRCIADDKQTIFISDKGFFIIVNETEPMTPQLKIYNGTRLYIKPEHRNGKVLKEFYDTMFKAFPNGTIVGLTMIHSKHISVLEKRHTRVANLYVLNREL